MTKAKNKKTTLNDLAGMVNRGFDSMERKFDKMFAENKKEHKQIFQKLESLEKRIIYIEDVITKHSKELKAIKRELKALKSQKEPLEQRVILLEQKVEQLEAQIKSYPQIDALLP